MSVNISKDKSSDKPCPHCGYYPHCGRSNILQPWVYPIYPTYLIYPTYPITGPTWTITSSSEGDYNASS